MRPTTSPWSDKHCVHPHATRESTGCIATAPGPRAAIALAVVYALAACSNAESQAGPAAPPAPTRQVQPVASAATPPPDAGAPAAVQRGSAEPGRDPFAGIDPTQSDVLRNIARLDPGVANKATPRPLVPRSVDAAAATAGTDDAAPPGAAPPTTALAGTAATSAAAAAAGTAADAPAGTIASPVLAAAGPAALAIGATAPGPASASGSAPAPLTASNPATVTPPAPDVTPTLAATAVTAAGAAAATRRAIAQPPPSFPRDALREGIDEGRVVANLAVAADGRVTDVTVVSTTPSRAFGRAAQQALRDWRYEAAAAPSSVQVELVFRNE
jgi:TonB family protein